MTKCTTLDGAVINVGPWDYQIEQREEERFGVIPEPILGKHVITVEVVTNPIPDGAIEEDIELAWTADGRIVKATDPTASSLFLQGTS